MNYLPDAVAECAGWLAVSAHISAEWVRRVWGFQKAAKFVKSLISKHTMTDFGSNFRKLREWAELSQEALGINLNVSASVVNRIENNKRKLDIQILQKLAVTLQLDISLVVMVLFKGKDALPKQKGPKSGKNLPVPA
jgi:ribosome-binding protein aMBF1 (putative translation factor)